jgi:Protein of unknown function (DUF3667)
MAPDPTRTIDASEEPMASVAAGAGSGESARGPFTLAALLDLNEEDLAEPLSRVAPPEHRWEQLSLSVTPESGDAIPAELRSGVASQPPVAEMDLIPGLGAPGAVEVPVYLAGRTLDDFLRNTPDSVPVIDADHALHPAQNVATPAKPPAIAVTVVGRPRKKQEAPAANFAKATEGPVLWPKHKTPKAPSVLPQECAKCGTAFHGEHCAKCGHDTAVPAHLAHTDTWGHVIAAFLDSDSRSLRTLGALVLAPGELTRAWLTGHRRRYFTPITVATTALLIFAVVSAVGGLRPRPDRALMIGADRTAEVLSGLVQQAPLNLAIDAPPDLLRDVATTMDYIPLLWFPLMAFAVVAMVAALRSFQRSDDRAEAVFAAHFASWFVLWWGLAVPVLLLTMRFGFEYSAAWDGVDRIRYLRDGQIAGLSPTWNAMRAFVSSPQCHTGLVALGLVPWAVVAWRRAFDSTWLRAGIAGLLVAAVPALLLAPFA